MRSIPGYRGVTARDADGRAEAKSDAAAEVAGTDDPTGGAQHEAAAHVEIEVETQTETETETEAAPGNAVVHPPEVLDDPAAEWSVPAGAVDFTDPLMGALAQLSALLGRPISTEALTAGLPHVDGPTPPELAIRAAERAGLRARLARKAHVADIAAVTMPCVLLLRRGEACVLLAVRDQQAEIIAPEHGQQSSMVDLATLETDFVGYAIFARLETRVDARAERIQIGDPREWFWGTLARFWPIYSHVVIASLLINCFVLASPLFVMNVYDRVVPNNATQTLWVLAIGVGTAYLFEFILRNLRTYFVDVAGKNADVIIASRLLQQLMAIRMEAKPPSVGAMANNLREFESLREFYTSGTMAALVDLPFIFLFIGVIALLAGPLALVPLIMVPLVIGAGLILQFPLRRVVERAHQESNQKHALLIETIDGLETIKAVSAESRMQGSWERFVGATARSSTKARFISGIAITFSTFAIQFTSVLVVVWGVYQIAEGKLTTGALVAATLLSSRALAPLGAIAAMVTRLAQSRVALKALDGLMKMPTERTEDSNFLHRPKFDGDIEFRNVSFAYPTQQGPALHDVSFRIRPGERVGLLGRIGSGKSTAARLMCGLYEPIEGAVLVDGTDLRQVDPADLRRNVGYVSQDNYLFYGSVRYNIGFGAPQMDDASILRAATTAGVTDFVRTHPQGFDLQVGERGMSLSGGQRQSIVVARALLQDPPMLVLDEPTSCMDNATEAMFKQRLGNILPGKTLILVTHRSSLLSLVDRLIIFDGGRIVADGPREEVLSALRQGQVRAAIAARPTVVASAHAPA
jgi:ATP-binding cassette subfamily C protein LapB